MFFYEDCKQNLYHTNETIANIVHTYGVITLCGSMKFEKELHDAMISLTSSNYAVFDISYNHRPKLQQFKIRHSDAIYVVDIGGYIGESTAEEIRYARKIGVTVIYLEEPDKECMFRHNLSKIGHEVW